MVTPVNDRPEFIGRAIESVQAQTVRQVEMIVVVVLFHARQGFFIVAVPNVPLAYGFEYHVALIGGLLCTALAGPGALSILNRLKPRA